jgi:hypothetical protein
MRTTNGKNHHQQLHQRKQHAATAAQKIKMIKRMIVTRNYHRVTIMVVQHRTNQTQDQARTIRRPILAIITTPLLVRLRHQRAKPTIDHHLKRKVRKVTMLIVDHHDQLPVITVAVTMRQLHTRKRALTTSIRARINLRLRLHRYQHQQR